MALEYRIDEKVLLEELVQKRKDPSWRYLPADDINPCRDSSSRRIIIYFAVARGLADDAWEPSNHKGGPLESVSLACGSSVLT